MYYSISLNLVYLDLMKEIKDWKLRKNERAYAPDFFFFHFRAFIFFTQRVDPTQPIFYPKIFRVAGFD